MRNRGSASENGRKIGNAVESGNHEADLSKIPEMIKFYHSGKVLYLGKHVWVEQ